MSGSTNPQWFVVMTHSHSERLAQEHLQRQGGANLFAGD